MKHGLNNSKMMGKWPCALVTLMGKTMEEMNHFYGSLKEMSTSMSSTVHEAARTKEQMTQLADNLTQLNQVYSKMIHAMQGK